MGANRCDHVTISRFEACSLLMPLRDQSQDSPRRDATVKENNESIFEQSSNSALVVVPKITNNHISPRQPTEICG